MLKWLKPNILSIKYVKFIILLLVMEKKITYEWGDDHVLIMLGNRIQPRIKALYWAEFFLTTGFATICILGATPLAYHYISIFTVTGAGLLYMLAAYRLLSRVFFKERLLLNVDRFEVITKTPFSFKTKVYEWRNMGPLHYVGHEKKTDHPLKGKCYDYFGFETQEKLIHHIHSEGNLYFNYGGFPVRFGKGVYSWDAEDIVNMMKLYIGNKLLLGPEWDNMVQEHEADGY